jgi:VPDSG-CTERM motif
MVLRRSQAAPCEVCRLLAVALACNLNAKQEGKQQKEEKVKWNDPLPDGKKDKRPYSVPDAGSTAALLGVSVAIIALVRRKIATRVE